MSTNLKRILDGLGSTVLGVAALPVELPGDVTGVHIYDPLDELLVAPGGLLLGIGVEGDARICELLTELGSRHAAGLVVKALSPPGPRVQEKVTETGVALLGLTRAASWAQIAALLRSLLAEGDVFQPVSDRDGEHEGDLFAVANAVCELLDAPVTIEDRSSKALMASIDLTELASWSRPATASRPPTSPRSRPTPAESTASPAICRPATPPGRRPRSTPQAGKQAATDSGPRTAGSSRSGWSTRPRAGPQSRPAWSTSGRSGRRFMNQGRIVESGTVEQIVEDPQEAYTKSLLEAVPRLF